MPTFSVLEHSVLKHGDAEGQIPPHLAARLAAAARAPGLVPSGAGSVLEDRRSELRARGVVGVLAAEGCALEILPKIDMPAPEGSPEARGAIRRRLVHMLAVALDLKLGIGRLADLDWQRETLLEILIRLFCERLTEAVRRGLPRRYVGHADDLRALRGTLDVPVQFTRHAVNPSRIACRFDELSQDIALNRIMKACVLHLAGISRSGVNQQRLRELAFVLDGVSAVPVRALRWDEVILDRTNHAWRDLLALAGLLLRGRYQTTSMGEAPGTALLFDMGALFEEYVGRMIRRAVMGTDFDVSLQGGREYCLTRTEDGQKLFQTRPDVLIRRRGRVVQIIDTKWKRIGARIEDPKQGVSQADIYQMMAYAHLYGPARVTLLFPHHQALAATDGPQARFVITNGDTLLEIASVNLGDQEHVLTCMRDVVLHTGNPSPTRAPDHQQSAVR